MPESVYDVILLIGSSKESWEKAAANAVEQASKSLRDLRVAEIVELDMQLDAKGKVEAYRAKGQAIFQSRALKTRSTLARRRIRDVFFRRYPAAHVAFEFVDRRRLRSPHDVEGNGLCMSKPRHCTSR